MSRRLLTGLLALALAVLIGVLWFEAGGTKGAGEGREGIQPAASPVAGERSGRRSTELLAGEVRDEGREDEPRAAAVEDAPGDGVASIRRSRWDRPRNALWVSGQVVLPPGVPFDEQMVVEAEGSAFPSDPNGRRHHRVRCDENGNFRVAFAPKTRYGRIGLVARYLYLDERVKVELFDPANHEGLRIEPKLGGLVVAQVLPPRHAAFEDDPLRGVTVAGSKGGGFGDNERDGWWSGRESEWEVGGLAPGDGYVIEARSPLWANGRKGEVEVTAGRVTQVDVALSVGARLSGTVVDELGDLVTTAEVRATEASDGRQRWGFFGGDGAEGVEASGGRFELNGVPPGEVRLVAEAQGYLEGRLDLGELTDGSERHNLVVRLDSGGKVSGVVRWPRGDQAEGAVVRVVQGDSIGNRFKMQRLKGEMKVGADGRFMFSGLEPQTPCSVTASSIHPEERPDPNSRVSLLQAKKTPQWVASQTDIRPGAPPLDLELSPGDVLSGKVVDDAGEPVLHFAVLASPAGSSLLSSSSRKPVRGRFRDEQGEFHLKGVQPGDWEVKVSAAGHADSERRRLTVPHGGDLAFTLARAGTIEGVVYGPDGDVSSGARVWAEHGGGQNTSEVADKDGVFELGKIYPGEVTLYADSDDAARSQPLVLVLSSAEEREGVVLRVQPGATIVGVVHPEAGEPGNREVTLRPVRDGSDDMAMAFGGRRQESRTDDDGSVEFTGLDAGAYELELAPAGNARWNSDPAEWILRTANRSKAEVEVGAGSVTRVVLGGPVPGQILVRGRITAGGEPVEKGLVTATDLSVEEGRPSGAVNAEEDGTYALKIDHAGKWRFSVRYEQGSWTSFIVDVPQTSEYTLDFELPESRIEGVVSGSGGGPLPEMTVTLVDAESDGRRRDWFAQKSVETDGEGRFRFDNLSPGTYHLRCGGGDGGFGFLQEADIEYGRVLIAIDVAEDSGTIEQDVRLPIAGEIFGNVRNTAGQPVPGARIVVTDEEGRRLSQFDFHRSGPDGNFTYSGVGPGSYRVTASRNGDSQPEAVKVYEGGRSEVNLVVDTE